MTDDMTKTPGELPTAQDADSGEQGVLAFRLESSSYAGPFPPPTFFAAMQQVIPEFPERFMREWATQAKHRRALENKAQETEHKLATSGQMMGFIIAILGLFGACFMAWVGAQAAAVTSLLVGLTPLAGQFVTSRDRNRARHVPSEKDEKQPSPPFGTRG